MSAIAGTFTVQVMTSMEAARRIRELRRLGLSYRQIAAHLDRKGIKPDRATHWSAMTVRNIANRMIDSR